MKINRPSGFTLIEALLSIALLTIIAGIAAPLGMRFYTRNNLEVATHSLTQTIRKAQTYSIGAKEDSTWGIRIDPPNVILFKGTSFASRDQLSDESYTLPNTIGASGINEVIFGKMNGEPSTTANIILTNSDSETKTISINSKGLLAY